MSAIPPAYQLMGEEVKSPSSSSSSSSHSHSSHSINRAPPIINLGHPPITSYTSYQAPLDPNTSFSTPHALHPWDMSEPGGRTTFLPGPDHVDDVFASSVHDVESEGLLEPPSMQEEYVQVPSPTSAAGPGNAAAANGEKGGSSSIPSYVPPPATGHAKLSQWFATAICGNDITSSCFYVTGICVASAGVYAPICMLMVAATLYLFRSIYGESVTALPLNGGAYNVLLNTTSKSTAAIAACLTILSYMATAVVSAASAIEYLTDLFPSVPVVPAVLLLLVFFALLCLWGISESADVALFIFTLHMFTLFTLVLTTIIWTVQNGFPEFLANVKSSANPPLLEAVFYGFASAMLGVSGFESSANFVEEQAEGVFVLTLRNMWAAVGFFNPVIATLSVCVFSIELLQKDNNQNVVLALLAAQCGGPYLRWWVCIDAFLVLAGSVLTAFVGVNGLCRRLALDRCLPQVLLAENRWRKTNHFIILGFLFICASIYLLLSNSIDDLASVYAVSFLSVMSLFAIGNMLLKYKRGFLPRSVRASWLTVFAALLLVFVALTGVLAKDPSILSVWFVYFVSVGFFLAVMFFRVQSLKILYHALHSVNSSIGLSDGPLLEFIARTVKSISSQAVGFFVKSGSISILNKAILYVRQNEDCAHIRIIHVYDDEARIPRQLLRNVSVLDEAYPKVKIDLILVKGKFGPPIIDYLAGQLAIPKNLLFITCPKEDFSHKLESLGGVRLITH